MMPMFVPHMEHLRQLGPEKTIYLTGDDLELLDEVSSYLGSRGDKNEVSNSAVFRNALNALGGFYE